MSRESRGAEAGWGTCLILSVIPADTLCHSRRFLSGIQDWGTCLTLLGFVVTFHFRVFI